MKIKWFVTGIILFMLFSPGHGYSQESLILGSDWVKLFEGFGQYFVTPDQAEKLPETGQIAEGAAVFKIIQVQNIAGNNPFNTYQPVFNFGGVLLSNVDDLISCIRGGACQSGSSGGGGQTMICSPDNGVSNTVAWEDSVGVYIIGGSCKVVKLNSGGTEQSELLYVMGDEGGKWRAGSGISSHSEYTMDTPPSGNPGPWAGAYIVNTGTYSARVHHRTGLKYLIDFTVTILAAATPPGMGSTPRHNVKLTVNSLTQIP